MDKEASSSRLRSPLSSIGNLSQPASEEQTLGSSVCNASAPDLAENGQDSIPPENVTESELPQVQTAKKVYFTPFSPIERENTREAHQARSRSLDAHPSTQLDSIQEIPDGMSSLHQARHSHSRSLDEEQFPSRAFSTLPGDKPVDHSSVTQQQPVELSQGPSEGTSQSFSSPRNSPTRTTQYHIPLPHPALRERLNDRPSPDQLLEQRRNSTTSSATIQQADNSRPSREIRQAPRSDKIGVAQFNGFPVGDTIDQPRSLSLHLYQSGSSRPTEPLSQVLTLFEVEDPPHEVPKRSRWKKVWDTVVRWWHDPLSCYGNCC